ncbi:MAG: hypothetical protein IPK85_23615 [Gemmatimonadetes bacterium]|nr:hypothetical protein [Gemmatimonadota bacterium]
MPDENLPAASNAPIPLTRAAIERVLSRAAELNVGDLDASDGMSEAQLVSLGQEVGISASHVRQALAEERTRVEVQEERGMLGAMFGGTTAAASRIVPGTPAAVLARLDDWMQREELLRPKRRFGERLTWEARRDFIGSLQAGLNFSGRPYALTRANEVGATAIAIDATRSLVSLNASLAESRRGSAIAAGAVGGVGVAGAVAVAALVIIPGGYPWLAALLGGGWASSAGAIVYGIGRAQKSKLHRLQLGLEQILDRLEHGADARRGATISDLLTAITR